MISLDLMKSSEVRKAGDWSTYVLTFYIRFCYWFIYEWYSSCANIPGHKIRISRGLAVNKNIMHGFLFQIKKECQFSRHRTFSKVNTKSTFYNSRHRFQLNNLMKAFTMLSLNFDLINGFNHFRPSHCGVDFSRVFTSAAFHSSTIF